MFTASLRNISGPILYVLAVVVLCHNTSFADDVTRREAVGQPLAANVRRLLQALDSLGAPLEATRLKTSRRRTCSIR